MTRDELSVTLSEYAGATPEEQATIAEKILAENDRIITESEQHKTDFETATEQYRELRKKYVRGVLDSVLIEQPTTQTIEPETPGPQKTTFDSLFTPVN